MAGAAALAAVLYLSGGLEWAERHLMDLRFPLAGRPAGGRVVVVAIDPKSLAALDVWPWPRGYHATVLENLVAADASRIAFDVDFSSRSIEEEDLALEEVLRAAGRRVILPTFYQWQTAPDGVKRLVATRPLERFGASAAVATINIQPDGDGLVRRYGLGSPRSGQAPPSLAAALAGRESAEGFYLDFGIDPASIPVLSYVDVLSGVFDSEAVSGKVVIVGATALELGDQAPVPLHVALPGPILQALACESLSARRDISRASPSAVLLLVLGVALAGGLPMLRASWRAGLVALAVAGGLLFAASVLLQRAFPLMLDLAPPGAALACCYALCLMRRIDQQEIKAWLASLRARHSELRMRHVVQNCAEAILTLDADGRIVTFNRAAESLFDCPAAQASGRRFTDLVPLEIPPPAGPATHPAADSPEGSAWRREAVIQRDDGQRRFIDVAVSSFMLDDQSVRVAFLRDVTEGHRHQETLRHQATHDALTDLPNRNLLFERMQEVLDGVIHQGGRAALLMLDLDRFKEINDTLGHTTGDRLLCLISSRLSSRIAPGGTIARLGGDEFAVLLPGAGAAEAEATARELIESLVASFEVQGMNLQVDGSVGIALCPEHGVEAGLLLQRADVAMYVAKRQRNTFCFYQPEEDANSLRHLTLKGEMREAIDRDLFELHYQPKIDLETEAVVGAEALLRWRHPQHGPLSPVEFIPLAERTGLIKPLTHWVLRTALTQAARWDGEGLRLALSVNCSARNLLEDDLPETIGRLLGQSGLSPDRLILEITETAIIEDPERSLSVLHELAGLGVKLSIDDFGTAYSSLDYLRKLPARELKIDKSFVTGIDREESDATIVRATIRLARDFGLTAVAEGIESRAVMDQLRALGCHQGQGHYISRPLPAAEFRAWLLARQPAEASPSQTASQSRG